MDEAQQQHPTRGKGGLLVSIIEALTQQSALIAMLTHPGKIVIHFDPNSKQKPVVLEFDFKI